MKTIMTVICNLCFLWFKYQDQCMLQTWLTLPNLSFRLNHFDGLIPFDFKTEPADSNSKYLGEHIETNQYNP